MALRCSSVLLSHPHANAVSQGCAAALQKKGMLACLMTGVAAAEDSLRGAALVTASHRFPSLANRVVSELPAEKVVSHSVMELGVRAFGRLARRVGMPRSTYDDLYTAHDARVAFSRWPDGVDAVYAYEDAALRTLDRARLSGMMRIWDLPLPHWQTLERVWTEESQRWPSAMGAAPPVEPEWKKKRKDRELELASVISVASAFTAESVQGLAGSRPVVTNPYGFPTTEFQPRTQPPAGPFTVLSVGTHDLRKGTPYLLEAWKRAGLKDAQLKLIGPMKLTDSFLLPYVGLYEHVPHLAKALLPDEYRAADVLLFPTLGDGFGLVIQEAMCCATPVITTRCGGGPECITNGVHGWIEPERNVEALVERLRWCSVHRDRVFEVGQAARRRAEEWTWNEAGEAFASSMASLSC